jgi:beta-xylosidase
LKLAPIAIAVTCGLSTLCAYPVRAENGALTQFTPGQSWLDTDGHVINAHGGGILIDHGTYYWFGQHMVAGGSGNANQVGVHVYSSQDLLNWKDRGIALPVSSDPQSPIAKGKILERPKVFRSAKTGKYVMWFHVEDRPDYRSAFSGVATADSPTGPYTFLGASRPDPGVWPDNVPDSAKVVAAPEGKREEPFQRDFAGGQMARDMTVFVDDDGSAYHVFSSEDNSAIHISRLSPDGLTHDGRWVRVFAGKYREAPALFKRAGRYYMITSACSGWAPNAAMAAVADSIWGPWTELGNPVDGTPEQQSTTFGAQSTYVLPDPNRKGEFLFMADQWRPENPIDGRYVWLPIEWDGDRPVIRWRDAWDFKTKR